MLTDWRMGGLCTKALMFATYAIGVICRNVMAAGDRRMLLPSWEDVEAGTAHQDESLRLDDVENDT